MKTLNTLLISATLTLSFIGVANATKYQSADNTLSTQICMTAAEGSRIEMHRSIKDSGFSKSFIYNNVKCNNQHLSTFIAENNEKSNQMNTVFKYNQQKGNVSINDLAKL